MFHFKLKNEYGWKSLSTTLHTSNQCLCKNSLWKIPQRAAKLEGRYFAWRHIRHQSLALDIDDELYYKNQDDEWNTASKFGLIKKPPSTHHQVSIFFTFRQNNHHTNLLFILIIARGFMFTSQKLFTYAKKVPKNLGCLLVGQMLSSML